MTRLGVPPSVPGLLGRGVAAVLAGLLLAVLAGPGTEPAAAAPVTAAPAAASAAGCAALDAVCSGALPAVAGAPRASRPSVGSPMDLGGLGEDIPGLGEVVNPFGPLGGVVTKAAADAWTAAMLGFWSAGLYVLRVVLSLAELFVTPDLSPDGPGRDVYGYALWVASVLVVILAMVQLGVAAFKREGKSLARALVGSGQFVVVCSGWFLYGAMVIAAAAAVNEALMRGLLGVSTWSQWDPLGGVAVETVADAVVATVLGLLGLLLWVAAIAHLLVYLARAAALIVLAATGPIAAAGLVADAGRAWFWKSLRWFHAAAFTPVLMTVVLGVGVKLSTGVAAGLADDTARAVGTALPAVVLICVSAVAPLALFKLLAFVDPGTPSGASFRQGMALQGGLRGLLTGSAGDTGGPGSAASVDGHGRSSGEHGAEQSTSSRFGAPGLTGTGQAAIGGLGPVGAGLAAGLGMLAGVGAKGTSLLADETNQSGVGHQTYGPDFSAARIAQSHSLTGRTSGRGDADTPGDPLDGDLGGPADSGDLSGGPAGPGTPAPPYAAPGPGPGPGAGTGTGPGAGPGSGGGPGGPGGPGGTGGVPKPPGGAGGGAGAAGGAAGGSVPPVPA